MLYKSYVTKHDNVSIHVKQKTQHNYKRLCCDFLHEYIKITNFTFESIEFEVYWFSIGVFLIVKIQTVASLRSRAL